MKPSRPRAVTLREVAERAGVARGTASHVLTGNPDARIGEATRERVRRAAAELGYRPNLLAKRLSTARSDTVGVVVSGLTNPLFVDVMETTLRRVAEFGLHALVDVSPSSKGSFGHLHRLAQWAVDGLLVWAPDFVDPHEALTDDATRLPIVFMGGSAPRPGGTSVLLGVEDGIDEASAYLIGRGYRRPAFFAPYPLVDWQDEPRSGRLIRAFAEVGIEMRLLDQPTVGETIECGFATGRLVAALPPAERPDLAILNNDVLALGAIHGLRAAGLRVPHDVAVLGHDGIALGQSFDVPLTTVRVPVAEICGAAVESLLARLSGVGEPGDARFGTSLLVGASA